MSTEEKKNIYGAVGDKYYLSPEQIKKFDEEGYLHLENVAPEETLLSLDEAFNYLTLNEENISKIGKDIGDVNGEVGKPISNNAGISIMLPRQYFKDLKIKILESRCEHISKQSFGDNMLYDFDRFIAKKPNRKDAIFDWHQDKLYCTSHGDIVPDNYKIKDDRAAIFSIAIDDTTKENGCIQYVIGSHKENELRKHVNIEIKTSDGAEIVNKVTKTLIDPDKDKIVMVPIKKGDLTVHGNRIVHGSSGNQSNGWRRSYMIQFRSQEQVQLRLSLGISRSFNMM
jgi:phytanoyl-CoA hydroxylase